MFTNPIKHTRLRGMEELLNFSIKTNFCSDQRDIFCFLNEQFAFTDCSGYIHVTPFRSEITNILVAAGYKAGTLVFPCISETEEEAYDWLRGIADDENWAETYETAYNLSLEKGIQPVTLDTHKLQIKEILYCYDDDATHSKYERMTTQFLTDDTKKNIATYILVDEKIVLICDEYGRTFLVKAKIVINDVMNALIDAGYTRTTHPEKYIHTLIGPF